MIELMLYKRMVIELAFPYVALLVYLSWVSRDFFKGIMDGGEVGQLHDDSISKIQTQNWINNLAVQQAGMLCAHTGSNNFDWIRAQVYSWWKVM